MIIDSSKKGNWISSTDPEPKPQAISLPNAPLKVLKKLASKKPLRRPQPPKQP